MCMGSRYRQELITWAPTADIECQEHYTSRSHPVFSHPVFDCQGKACLVLIFLIWWGTYLPLRMETEGKWWREIAIEGFEKHVQPKLPTCLNMLPSSPLQKWVWSVWQTNNADNNGCKYSHVLKVNLDSTEVVHCQHSTRPLPAQYCVGSCNQGNSSHWAFLSSCLEPGWCSLSHHPEYV